MNKLKLFANIIQRKRKNRVLIFFSLLLLLKGGKLKKVAFLLSAFILFIVGATYTLNYKNQILINQYKLSNQNSLDSILELKNLLKINEQNLLSLRDSMRFVSNGDFQLEFNNIALDCNTLNEEIIEIKKKD